MPHFSKCNLYSFFWCCQSDSEISQPLKRAPSISTTNDSSANPQALSRQNTTTNPVLSPQEFLLQKGMGEAASHSHAAAMTDLLKAYQTLASFDLSEIQQAIEQWTINFAHTPLTKPRCPPAWPSSTHFAPMDSELMQALQTDINQGHHDVFTTNLLTAILSTYEQMNTCRQQHSLIYHQPRHAAEMFADVHQLLNQHADTYDWIHLLAVLCALFHDIQFTHVRIVDEQASAEALKKFLTESLVYLSDPQKSIITALIDVLIVGATLPCFLSKNQQGQEGTATLANLAQMTTDYFTTFYQPLRKDNGLSTVLDVAHIIGAADIQRTCFSILQTAPAYTDPHWQTLAFLFQDIPPPQQLAAQLRLTQNLRALAEMNAKPTAVIYPLVKTIAKHQNGIAITTQWDESLRQGLADILTEGANSEVAFAQRMANSHDPNTDDSDNEWPKHVRVLKKLQQYLTGDDTLVNKRQVLSALAAAAADQHGSQLNLSEIEQITKALHSMAGLTAPSIIPN